MKNSGFTLIEVIVVVSVVAILAALSYPVFVQAKHSSKKSVSVQRMRQVHAAAMVYQVDEGGGAYGDVPVLGLPNAMQYFTDRFGMPLEVICSGCGPTPKSWRVNPNGEFHYVLGMGGSQISDAVMKYQDRFPYLVDFACNPPDAEIRNPFTVVFTQSVTLGGSLVTKRARGFAFSDPWRFLYE